MYGSVDEPSKRTYDDYVESMRERMITAHEEARATLRKTAERNKRYDIRVRAKEYRKGQYTTSIFVNLSDAKTNGSESIKTGQFLIIDTPSPVTVKLQRRKRAKTMTVHIDKVKPFLGEVPKSWLADEPSSDVRELPERADDMSMDRDVRQGTQ